MEKVIVIVGPTGVGKTKLSIELAKRFKGEIINGDSVQVYKQLDIGSAKVTDSEMEGVPHHLLDIKEPAESFSVAEYQKLVRSKISELTYKGKLPIIVGGTGLYTSAVIYDYEFIDEEEVIDNKKYMDMSNEELHAYLMDIDKDSAEKIHPNNRRRVIRAIDIYEKSGETKSDILERQENKLLYDAYIICLEMDRSLLYERINKRVDIMIENGLIEEVRKLYDQNIKNVQSVSAIGYKELYLYFNGEVSLEESIELIKRNTRRYAKRQFTWFRNKMDVKWFNVDVDNFQKTIDEVECEIVKFMK